MLARVVSHPVGWERWLPRNKEGEPRGDDVNRRVGLGRAESGDAQLAVGAKVVKGTNSRLYEAAV
jgi:hypothetical protein